MINIENIEEKSYFNIGTNEYYEGYHIKERRWNGFATPKFEKRVADIICQKCSSSDLKIQYDEEKASYIVTVYEGNEIIDTYSFDKFIIDTTEGKKEVYAIGSYYWTWDDYSLDEIKEDVDGIIITNTIEVEKETSIDIDY